MKKRGALKKKRKKNKKNDKEGKKNEKKGKEREKKKKRERWGAGESTEYGTNRWDLGPTSHNRGRVHRK